MRTGERLRMARSRLRMTQKELAGEEFHRSLVSQIETGLIEPSLQTLTVLADRVGLPTSFFIESEGEQRRTERAITEAEEAVAQGHPDRACRQLVDTLTLVSSFPLKARILIQLGKVLLIDARSAEALAYLQVSHRYLRVVEDAPLLTLALLYTGYALADLNRHSEAVTTFGEAAWLLEHTLLPSDRAERQRARALEVDIALAMARSRCELNQFTDAIEWLQRGIDVATDAELYDDLGRAHLMTAFVHHRLEQYSQAAHHARLAATLLDAPESPIDQALCLVYQALLHLAQGAPDAASPLLDESLSLFTAFPEHRAMAYPGLAVTYFTAGAYPEASEWARRTITFLLEEAPPQFSADRQGNLIRLLVLLSHFEVAPAERRAPEACDCLQECLAWFRREGHVMHLWRSLERHRLRPDAKRETS